MGVLKENIQKLGGIPVNISFNTHKIEIQENKFNCVSNLLKSKIFNFTRP